MAIELRVNVDAGTCNVLTALLYWLMCMHVLYIFLAKVHLKQPNYRNIVLQ